MAHHYTLSSGPWLEAKTVLPVGKVIATIFLDAEEFEDAGGFS